MKITLLFFFSFIVFTVNQVQGTISAVTYDSPGGRFGDQVFSYIQAKWISYKYDIPLLYKPIQDSELLVLHDVEQHYNHHAAQLYKMVKVNNESEIQINKNAGFLYYTDIFFTPSIGKFEFNFNNTQCAQSFFNELKKLIKPKIPLQEPRIPEDMISIAVHVRKGSGDGPVVSKQIYRLASDQYWPTKFPPDQYYLDQIKRIAGMFKGKRLYVYIFTDHTEPRKIVDTYKKYLNNPNIIFDSREFCVQNSVTVLEDFFAMTKFDCLIRPQSAYSICAQLIGNHKVIIFPKKSRWVGSRLLITETGIITH